MHGRGIRAARDRTGDTADFRTNGHCFLLPQHLRAAKGHFYPDTTRPRTARFLRTRTPQGDGNEANVSRHRFRNVLFKNQNPARGRKPNPMISLRPCIDVFKNQNPARGRKHLQLRRLRRLRHVFKNQNPARGRKPRDSLRLRCACLLLRTRTPQGDGNFSSRRRSASSSHFLRTRTPQGDGNECNASVLVCAPYIFKNQNPARGRKLLT